MPVGRPITHHEDKIMEILRLIALGTPERQICKMLGVGKGTVHRAKTRYELQDE